MNGWPRLEATGKTVGYARVSTAEQKLDMQLDALKAVHCDLVFSDQGVSGAKAQRPGLDKVLHALKPGDMLVVFKLDRLGRSVLHLADLLTYFQTSGINFCSLSEGINTTTPGGKLVYHVFSAVAEFQRDLIRENAVYGLRAARERGKRLGRPPLLNEMSILEAHRMRHQQHKTIDEIARLLKVSPSTIRRRLDLVDKVAVNAALGDQRLVR